MLSCCKLPFILRGTDEGCAPVGDHVGVVAESARVDDRIGRVIVHIEDGIEVDVNADGAPLARGDAGGLRCGFRIACGGQRHRARQARSAAKLHSDAALKIRSEQERHARARLQAVC